MYFTPGLIRCIIPKKGLMTMKRTSPYSIDLREKVIAHLASGTSKKATSKLFGICESIIYDWQRLASETGSLRPRKRLGIKPKIDVVLLKQYISDGKDTLWIANKFNAIPKHNQIPDFRI